MKVKAGWAVQRNLFHKMAWLDAPLFRMVASLRYANSAGAPTTPGPDHWRKVLVRSPYPCCSTQIPDLKVVLVAFVCKELLCSCAQRGFGCDKGLQTV